MNTKSRIEMVKAMNTIANSLNNEEFLEIWLLRGVADGDECYEDYIDDKTFADLMATFVRVMGYAINDEDIEKEDRENGNVVLYCDRIVSKRE